MIPNNSSFGGGPECYQLSLPVGSSLGSSLLPQPCHKNQCTDLRQCRLEGSGGTIFPTSASRQARQSTSYRAWSSRRAISGSMTSLILATRRQLRQPIHSMRTIATPNDGKFLSGRQFKYRTHSFFFFQMRAGAISVSCSMHVVVHVNNRGALEGRSI